jgi:hypothetical protein
MKLGEVNIQAVLLYLMELSVRRWNRASSWAVVSVATLEGGKERRLGK